MAEPMRRYGHFRFLLLPFDLSVVLIFELSFRIFWSMIISAPRGVLFVPVLRVGNTCNEKRTHSAGSPNGQFGAENRPDTSLGSELPKGGFLSWNIQSDRGVSTNHDNASEKIITLQKPICTIHMFGKAHVRDAFPYNTTCRLKGAELTSAPKKAKQFPCRMFYRFSLPAACFHLFFPSLFSDGV